MTIQDEILEATVPFAESPWSEEAKVAILEATKAVLAKHSPPREVTIRFELPNVIRYHFEPGLDDAEDIEARAGTATVRAQ